ncbi:metallophosphoesterase [Jeotgalibacillus sp. S-D1]|uniref:metallophosphoesterase n=1 Tax=Jeotgalibacillus sp. S-D1 TaxID=2552189 RepID=UPI001059C52C|nr:metallophosphoesterase [Jeotgalibacillus sp. S-D1]TDL34886.1 metallophosphoesterase [Jeotgalibacillus sp. S-D1]
MITVSFIIALLLYGLLSFYAGYNGWIWLKSSFLPLHKLLYIIFISIMAASFFIGRLFSFLPLELVGNVWFVIIGYSIILLPVSNIIVFLLKKKKRKNGIFWTGIGVLSLYFVIFVYGSFNAWSPKINTYTITIDKKSNFDHLKILMASDLHLGPIVGKNHLQRLVDLSEEVKPDIVLLPGDIIDDDVDPYIKKNMGEVFNTMQAPLGIHAVPGNHEYYGNDLDEIILELEQDGINFLMDEALLIEDDFYIAGRKDLTDSNRKTINEITGSLDHTKPVIMLDHQPFELNAAAENKVDVLLSGHTHKGQLAPANLVTSMIYENDWGYLKKQNMHSFVSSGFGTWGPPFRIGSRSEVMVINIKFIGD